MRKNKSSQGPRERDPTTENLTLAHDWAKSVHFKHVAIGGVDEADVWKKISKLTSLYEAALAAERLHCTEMIQAAKNRDGDSNAG